MQSNQDRELEKQQHLNVFNRIILALFKAYPKTWQYIAKEEPDSDNTALAEDLRKLGVQEENIAILRQLLKWINKANHNTEATIKLEQYIFGGIVVLNALLFQVLAGTGRTDLALSISWIAFVISLPCTAGALFLSTKYGKIKNLLFPLVYNIISNAAFFGCGISITAFIWHYWDVAGWIFAILAGITYILCLNYESVTRIRQAAQDEENSKGA